MSENPKPPILVEGERILLQARSEGHAAEMFKLIEQNREHLGRWMPWEETTQNVADSIAYLDLARGWWEKGTTFDFSVFEKESSKMIGSFGLHSLDWDKNPVNSGIGSVKTMKVT